MRQANPSLIATNQTVQALAVGKCTTCQGYDILLPRSGLAQLAPGK